MLTACYHITTKKIATCLEKVHLSQATSKEDTLYIGKSIHQIADAMDFTKRMQIPGITVVQTSKKTLILLNG